MKLCQNSSWKEEKIKTLFIERVEKNVTSNKDYLSIVKDVGVVPYSEKGNVGNKTSDNPENYKMVYQDDLVINPMNIKIGSVGISKYFGCLSSVYIVLKPNKKLIPNYYGYLFELKPFQKSLKKISNGIMEIRESINKIEFYSLKLPYPPLEQQQQIVSFLDSKIELIDSLIENSGRKIGLLKEIRTSLINETVSKGLSTDVEIKDSGVEWIGEIPSHWSYGQVRRFTIDHRQGYYSPDGYTKSGHRVVRITDLKSNNNIDINESPYYEMSEDDKERYELKKGDFLFQRTGSHKKVGVFMSSEPSVYGSFLIRFRFSKKINHEYLRFFFNSSYYKNQLNQQIHGGVNPNIHVENIKDCYTTNPPLEEQQQIVKYLNDQTGKIDKTISNEEKRIELLKEYRQSLISEVVTGKRKVTN